MDTFTPAPTGPPARRLGRDTARTVRSAPHWMALIPPAPHRFAGTGDSVQVSPRIWTYCPGGYQNQLIGCCVGAASRNAACTVLRIPPGAAFDPDDPAKDSPPRPDLPLSELWNYYWARNIHGDPGVGEGAVVAYALDAMMKVGVIPEALWPFTEANQQGYTDAAAPGPVALAEGLKHLVAHAARITTRGQYLDFLAQGYPVVDGVEINDGWERTDDGGAFPLAGKPLGGHATLTVGYDQRRNRLYKRNSWEGWGMVTADPQFAGRAGGRNNVGYCALDQYLDTYLTDDKLASGETDAFVLNDVSGFDAPKVSPVSAESLFT